jgi:hypothetical protein
VTLGPLSTGYWHREINVATPVPTFGANCTFVFDLFLSFFQLSGRGQVQTAA